MDILSKIKKKPPNILVVGDIMLDRFIFGNVHRISPEAPVPIVRSVEEKYCLGGCGNVIRNLTNMGLYASVVSIVGNDQAGKKIMKDLSKKRISTKTLIQSKICRTTEKMRIVAEGQQLVRVDWDTSYLTDRSINQVLKQASKKIGEVDGVIISDYNKGICTKLIVEEIITQVRKLKIPIFIDPKGKEWDKYSGATIITPNLKEAETVVGKKLRSEKDIEEAGREICDNFRINGCLITRGPNGMSYVSKDFLLHVSSEAKEIFDVSGAGDTVIAAFATGILAGFDPEVATRFANKAAGIVVGHIGTTAITIPELLENDN